MDVRTPSWYSTVTDRPDFFLRFGQETVKDDSYSSPIVRSRLQPEKGGAKLRCSCNRQMSDHNSAAMSRRVSILRLELAGTQATSTEARMGSRTLGFGFPFACSDEISQSVTDIRCRDARSSLTAIEARLFHVIYKVRRQQGKARRDSRLAVRSIFAEFLCHGYPLGPQDEPLEAQGEKPRPTKPWRSTRIRKKMRNSGCRPSPLRCAAALRRYAYFC